MSGEYTVPLTFALAGISNMFSGTITHPIDVVKVRMQCDSQNKGIYQRSYPGLVRGATKVGIIIISSLISILPIILLILQKYMNLHVLLIFIFDTVQMLETLSTHWCAEI